MTNRKTWYEIVVNIPERSYRIGTSGKVGTVDDFYDRIHQQIRAVVNQAPYKGNFGHYQPDGKKAVLLVHKQFDRDLVSQLRNAIKDVAELTVRQVRSRNQDHLRDLKQHDFSENLGTKADDIIIEE